MPHVKWTDDDESSGSAGSAAASGMNYVVGVISFLVIEFLWKVQLAVEKYFHIANDERLSVTCRPATPAPLPPGVRAAAEPKCNKKRKKKGLFFDPESGRRRSYLSLEDLISPAEEKMLRSLCARAPRPGDEDAEYEDCADLLRPEHQIPRSKFTAAWVESCGTYNT